MVPLDAETLKVSSVEDERTEVGVDDLEERLSGCREWEVLS